MIREILKIVKKRKEWEKYRIIMKDMKSVGKYNKELEIDKECLRVFDGFVEIMNDVIESIEVR